MQFHKLGNVGLILVRFYIGSPGSNGAKALELLRFRIFLNAYYD
jgi:hypothetical protein